MKEFRDVLYTVLRLMKEQGRTEPGNPLHPNTEHAQNLHKGIRGKRREKGEIRKTSDNKVCVQN